jgi:cytochrome c-type biogenesis protein CcsB
VTQTLDQFSQLLLYSAMGVYLIAFIAFALDLARRSAEVTAKANVATAVSGLAASNSATADETVRATESPIAQTAAEASADLSAQTDGDIGGVATLTRTTSGSSDGTDAKRRSPSLRIGISLTILGFVLHFAADLLRGIAAARVPWANMYEFSMTGTLIIVAVFLIVLLKEDLRFLGTFITGLVLILLGISTVGFRVDVAPLVPALQSYWLVLHVFVAILGTAFFALGFALSAAQLLQFRRESMVASARATRLKLLATLPNSVTLENLAYRVIIVGFIFWTFTLIAGAIWAEHAWGRYWGWDTKEVWTFIIWVIYAGYIHARATRGWRGSRSAWLASIGFAAVLFNFGIVNVFFKGLHAYSGL